jgi:hypothetical protein
MEAKTFEQKCRNKLGGFWMIMKYIKLFSILC